MTTIKDVNHAIDMTGFAIGDLSHASFSHTDTLVTAIGALYTYSFAGTGFGTGSGKPSSGTITSLLIDGNGADTTHTVISHINVDVFSLGFLLVTGGTWVDFEQMILGGDDTFDASTGNDNLFGYTGNDTFNMDKGGIDTVLGQDGNDKFVFGSTLTSADKVDGGANTDTVYLSGNYASGVTFNATTMINVETINLAAGGNYKLATNNATVAAGATLTINGSALGINSHMTIDGGQELDGRFVMIGGAGADVLTGGAMNDWFTGGLGGDTITGGANSDRLIYTSALESTGKTHDNIIGFDFSHDRIDLNFAITGVDKIRVGDLNENELTARIHDLFGADRLGADHATYFKATGGTDAGKIIIVIDGNHTAGFQVGADYIIEVDGATNLTHFDTHVFI